LTNNLSFPNRATGITRKKQTTRPIRGALTLSEPIRRLPSLSTLKAKTAKSTARQHKRLQLLTCNLSAGRLKKIAQSVAFWTLREDVQREFADVRGALMYSGMQAQSSPFFQDGLNTVTAWNVTIRVLWYHVMDTAQDRMPPFSAGGNIRNS